MQPVDHPQRRVLEDRPATEPVRHTVAEESHLHPAVRERVSHGAALADKEVADHAKVEQILKDHEDRHVDDPNTPPADKLLVPGAGLVDRVRDLLSGRTTAG